MNLSQQSSEQDCLFADHPSLEGKYQNLFNRVPFALVVTDIEGIICEFNEMASLLLKIPTDQVVIGKPLDLFISVKEHALLSLNKTKLKNGEIEQVKGWQTIFQDYDQREFPAIISAKVIKAFDDQQAHLLWSIQDNTERKRIESELQYLARTDDLTKIFNRRHFFYLTNRELKHTKRYARPIAMILFDLDWLKRINDTYGHLAGDQVLKGISKNCQDRLRTTDIFARYGGDEFIILLPDTDVTGAVSTAERIRKKIETTPIKIKPGFVSVTISLGISHTDQENLKDIDTLLDQADKALYVSKLKGKNQVTVWQPEHKNPLNFLKERKV
jgi:diguanylate cyclase (GGDEF)-like protein/PAS domain S-box-containing protein